MKNKCVESILLERRTKVELLCKSLQELEGGASYSLSELEKSLLGYARDYNDELTTFKYIVKGYSEGILITILYIDKVDNSFSGYFNTYILK